MKIFRYIYYHIYIVYENENQVENLPLFKLSDSHDMILFLIKKELQGTKFTVELGNVGFDTSLYTPDLGVLILSLMGFGVRTDELWNWYFEKLCIYSEKVDLGDLYSVRELAFEFYFELRTKLQSIQSDHITAIQK